MKSFFVWLQSQGLPTRTLGTDAVFGPAEHARKLLESPDSLTNEQRVYLAMIAGKDPQS